MLLRIRAKVVALSNGDDGEKPPCLATITPPPARFSRAVLRRMPVTNDQRSDVLLQTQRQRVIIEDV